MWPSGGEFVGTERFAVLRRLGEGGMGVVYEAEDRERGQRVALKTFRRADFETIYRLKQEFRALAQVSHPNLAALYDLVIDGARCFFTMELLDGNDFLTWVQPPRSVVRQLSPLAYAKTETTQSHPTPTPSPSLWNPPSGAPPTTLAVTAGPLPLACDERRLRLALPQLGLGLHALHQAGKIHRDIKPSNVWVTSQGRVVLLDFGLVADVNERRDPGSSASSSSGIVGTVSYMAPEQAAGETHLGPAADWYAVGCVLYQALTGRLPFEGPPIRVLQEKQQHAPPPPRSIVPTVAADLDELCCELLARDPRVRPVGAAALRRLGVRDGAQLAQVQSSTISRDAHLAGRARELGELEAAFEAVMSARAAAVMIRGASGIGKSSLVRRFLDQARARDPGTLVLAGRCYEHEAVPYRAMDSLVDHLSNHWCGLPADEARALLPEDAALLPTLFPVLGRVPAVADAPRKNVMLDTQEVRTRAFAALRRVLHKLARRHPLVLFIDDMQWVDGDTGTLLHDVMRAPDPPPLLLLLSTRPQGSEGVLPIVRRAHAEQRVVEVGPLAEDAALALATAHLGESANGELAQRIVREAAGSPFFLLELVRYMQGRAEAQIAGKGLDEVLGERIDALGHDARAVAEVVAVAGEPINLRTAAAASGIGSEELRRQLSLLRAQRFVRAAGGRAEDQVEPYHDRVREALIAGLSDERRARHHRMIATALTGLASHERLARHWHGAGEPERAAEHAWRAAEEAQHTLDFDRAAGLFRMALEGGNWADEQRRQLRTALAGALGDSGRPTEAAQEFGRAAEESQASEALELRRRAADALLRGGYVEQGLDAIRGVLAEFRLALARTPRRALLSLLWRRAWLRLRGLRWRPRSPSALSQEQLTRVDVLEGVAMGLAMVDVFRSGDYGTRFVLGALRLGDSRRVGRALALEADLNAANGDRRRAERLCAELERITLRDPTPQAMAQLITTQGMIDFLCNFRFRRALERLTEATEIYREHERRAGTEINIVQLFICWAQYYLGELGELSRRVPAIVEAAERSGDRFAAVNLRTAFPIVRLVRDVPDEAEADLEDALAIWSSKDDFQMQHFFVMCAHCDLAMYRGQPERGTARLARDRGAFRASLLHLLPVNKMLHQSAIGRLALARGMAAPPGSDERREAQDEARAVARALLRTRQALHGAFAQSLLAGIHHIDGDLDAAVKQLRLAIPALDQVDMALFAMPLRRRLGELLGGDEGAALCAQADAWLAGEGVANPARMMAMLAPGYRPHA
jgi:serine/threonine protein kinase/tetratricopeptide (TPR) repeat protein